jgi:hypothetical protein
MHVWMDEKDGMQHGIQIISQFLGEFMYAWSSGQLKRCIILEHDDFEVDRLRVAPYLNVSSGASGLTSKSKRRSRTGGDFSGWTFMPMWLHSTINSVSSYPADARKS